MTEPESILAIAICVGGAVYFFLRALPPIRRACSITRRRDLTLVADPGGARRFEMFNALHEHTLRVGTHVFYAGAGLTAFLIVPYLLDWRGSLAMQAVALSFMAVVPCLIGWRIVVGMLVRDCRANREPSPYLLGVGIAGGLLGGVFAIAILTGLQGTSFIQILPAVLMSLPAGDGAWKRLQDAYPYRDEIES